VVLKPLDMSEESVQWQLDVLSVLESGSPVRVAPPLRATASTA
jgi:hypothetical protein